jgi:crotonobetainyl-CoA:carnitine CoA-transferase CaiB-like acyl-CoA transferase
VQPLRGIVVVAVEQAVAGPICTRHLGDPDWRLDPIPALGEHAEPVLRELGFSVEELAVMRAEGVVAGE